LNATYAFNNFVNPAQGVTFKTARLIVNKPLEQSYSQKKKKMALECGGEDKVNEVYIWHGSVYQNYEAIMKDGLKVGGIDAGVGIANAAVHGYGVYSATTPNTPIGYAKDSAWLLCCLSLKGNGSPTKITDASQLDNGKTHSYETNGDWVIFFTKEQLLPRFLVEYKNIGT
jgi:hypothetical protein